MKMVYFTLICLLESLVNYAVCCGSVDNEDFGAIPTKNTKVSFPEEKQVFWMAAKR